MKCGRRTSDLGRQACDCRTLIRTSDAALNASGRLVGATGDASREAAQECSPGRKPWVSRHKDRAPQGRKKMEQLPKIVQQRLRGPAKPGVHPDPDLLTAFAEKSLNDRERAHVLQHLVECADCREVLSLAMPEIEPALAPGPERSTLAELAGTALGSAGGMCGGGQRRSNAALRASGTLAIGCRKSSRRAGGPQVWKTKSPRQPGQKLAANLPPPSPSSSVATPGPRASWLSNDEEHRRRDDG